MTDEELVRTAQQGQASAYAALIKLHSGTVERFALRLCINTSIDADDIVQEAFVVAWERISRLEDPRSFKSWVCQIAYRRFVDLHRHRKRRAGHEASLNMQPISENPDHDTRLDLTRAIAQLHPDQRAVVALCIGEGLSHSEAAVALRMPIGTVKSHMSRARIRLADILGEQS